MAAKKTIAKKPLVQRQSKHHEVKAQGVAMFFQGHTSSYIADALGVPLNTVKGWKREAMPAITKEMRAEWAEQIEYNLYRTIIMAQNAMLKQLEVMSDEHWIRTQTAHDLATLHGITHDKVVRLLEATGQGQEDTDEGRS